MESVSGSPLRGFLKPAAMQGKNNRMCPLAVVCVMHITETEEQVYAWYCSEDSKPPAAPSATPSYLLSLRLSYDFR